MDILIEILYIIGALCCGAMSVLLTIVESHLRTFGNTYQAVVSGIFAIVFYAACLVFIFVL